MICIKLAGIDVGDATSQGESAFVGGMMIDKVGLWGLK